MLPLRFDPADPGDRSERGVAGGALRLLCLGAHCDDVEIGAGGTVRRLLAAHPGTSVRWVVFCSEGRRAAEAQASAADFLAAAAEVSVEVHELRESFLPEQWGQVKALFEGLKDFCPDVVLTHHGNDAHQDHRTVSELTWNTFRDHQVLEYEIPKYDADLGRPSVFVPLTREEGEAKIRSIREHFASQDGRQWFDDETFWALMRLRGVECNARTRYAEAFHVRKLMLFGDGMKELR